MSDRSGIRTDVPELQDLSASVRRATSADAHALADLVNQAYVVEDYFVEGDRTTAAEVVDMMARGTFLVLDRQGAATLGGAVYVTIAGRRGYFGMLAVGAGLQGRGLGKRLVRIAEAMCEAASCIEMTMKIVNLREELARWYRSLGYRATGTTPYAGNRTVKLACHFVEMARPLGMPAALAA